MSVPDLSTMAGKDSGPFVKSTNGCGVMLPELISGLRGWGLTGEEIFRMRVDWRASPVSLSDLLRRVDDVP